MSQFDDIALFCEDLPNRPTARLLVIAVQSLRHELQIAGGVEPLPIGGKSDVKVRVRHAREDRRKAFGVRDRDFLERALLDKQRSRALLLQPGSAEAWPLRRHCIESYLLEPAYLVSVLGSTEDEWRTVVKELAEARVWTDLVRAALTDARWQISRLNWPHTGAPVLTRGDALAEISAQCAEMACVAGDALNEKRVQDKLDALALDFAADGPLTLRVDGKELLKALGARLRGEEREPKAGLLEALLSHAERHGCPQPLLDEVRELLQGIQISLGIKSAP